jgi:hypothetical protein
MSFYKKHVDRRLKEQETIDKVVGKIDAFVLVLHMRNNTKGLFVAGRRVL